MNAADLERDHIRCQGIAVALAELNRMHGQPNVVCDVLRGLGITLVDLVRAKVPNKDLREIRNCLTQGRARDRQQTDLVTTERAG